MFCNILCAVGILALFSFGVKLFNLINQFFRPRVDLKKLGEWSIVTGATSGIGKAMAFELAKRGQNVLIIGRNTNKLDSVASEIRKESPKVTIECLELDLGHMNDADKQRYRDCIEKKDVGVLINNAGLAYPFVQYFHEVDEKLIEEMIEVNCKAPTWLVCATLQKFLKKKKGAVVNIGSAGSVLPHELHEVYSGTKSYLNKWTIDMASSYTKNISKNITFQVQLPYFVVSNMSKISKPSLLVPSAAAYARAAVSQIGYSGQISPYPLHAIVYFVLSLIPNFLLEKYIGKLHHDIRKRGMKKKENKKNE